MSGEKRVTIGHVDRVKRSTTIALTLSLANPRTPEEYEVAERLEAQGLLTLNSDGTTTLTDKGEASFREFADTVAAERANLEAEARQ